MHRPGRSADFDGFCYSMDDLAEARQVLTLEATGINALADALDGSLPAAVTLLERVSGRVVVTGIGKSGHIARKIASTFASTGTPAQFVHPGEASHGDLGMITPRDAVLALSNSGETAEMSDLVNHCRRFLLPLIAITSRFDSTLAASADVCLLLPPVAEACPLGLAPTTSSTLMLALGDALAVVLLKRKGFTAEDFRNFHPGGKLGRILVKVADLMHGREVLPLASLETQMSDAIVMMSGGGFGCVGVVDGQRRLIGIITDGDLRRHMGPQLLEHRAAQVMTPNPYVIGAGALAPDALRIMNENQITSLFVVESDRGAPAEPVGILHVHDLLRAGVL